MKGRRRFTVLKHKMKHKLKGMEQAIQMAIFAVIILLIVAVAVYIAYQAYQSGMDLTKPSWLQGILNGLGGKV